MTSPVRLLQPLEPGCVLYMPFWEGAGVVAGDISPYRNNGSISGASWAAGVLGSCLSFNGVDNYVQADGVGVGIGGALTFSACVKLVGAPTVYPVVMFLGSTSHSIAGTMLPGMYLSGYGTNKQLIFRHQNADPSGYVSLGGNLDTTVWNHVAVTFDGVLTVTGYANGVQLSSFTYTSWAPTNPNLFLARHAAWLLLMGLIDEVHVYNQALGVGALFEHYYRSARYAG